MPLLPPSRFFAAILALALLAAPASAADDKDKLPHFATLRADVVNLRAGPGDQYPIEWVYQRKGLPVEVTAQFDVWRRVRDSDGTEGWVHERMLTAARAVVVTGDERTLRANPDASASAVARAEPGVVAKLVACKGAWCEIDTQGIKGWLPRDDMWGVYPDEVVE